MTRSQAARSTALGLCLMLGATRAGWPAEAAGGFDGLPVVAVEFDADEPLDERSLRRRMPLQEGTPFTATALAESVRFLDLKNVWSMVEPRVEPAGGGVRVVFRLRIRRTVSSIAVSGHETFYAEDLVRRIRISSGTPLTLELTSEAVERLEQYYRREGFPDVRVSVHETAQAHRQVHLAFEVHEGDPVLVAAVVFEGNLVLSPSEVAGGAGVTAGERRVVGLERQVRRSLQAFYREHDYYDADVSLRWDPQSPDRWVLLVGVEVGPKFDLRFVGNDSVSRETLLGLLDLAKRPVVTVATWRELQRRIVREYRRRGFYHAAVELEIEDGDGRRRVEYRIEEGERYTLEDVEFVGNEVVPAKTLEAVMQTRGASWVPYLGRRYLDDDVLNGDLRNIWFLYRRLGFQSAEVLDARTQFDRDAGTVKLTIEVREGPRSYVRAVEFEGFDVVAALPELTTRVGEPFNPEATSADESTLAKAVGAEGHPEAQVSSSVESIRAGDEVEATVRFRAQAGPYREVGEIIVQNNFITQDRVVLRELPFAEGSPLDPQALVDGQANVYRLGLFRGVKVRPLAAGDPEAPPVAVEVAEVPAGTFSYGLGYETQFGVRAFGEAAYANLQGLDRRVSLRGDASVLPSDPSQSQYLANLGFRTPRIFDTYWVSRSNAILLRNTLEINRYSFEGFTLATALEREILPRFIVGGIVEWDQGDTFDVAADANLAPEGVKDVGFLRQVSFGPFLELDRRDDPFAPRSGTIDTMQVRYAAKALNSDIGYFSVTGKHAQYIPLGEYLTFVYAVRGAWALPSDGKFTVPIRDRYFTGGRTTVRGFQERSIAPLGADGDPIGGDILLNGNAEMRFPLVFGLGGAVFYDTGGAFLRRPCTQQVCNFSALSWDNMRRSVGLGLRYLTPVGPISVEYGFKLDRRPGESLGEFHFSIGNIF